MLEQLRRYRKGALVKFTISARSKNTSNGEDQGKGKRNAVDAQPETDQRRHHHPKGYIAPKKRSLSAKPNSNAH